jgi:ABC-2 type transport system ATP-binding protein
MKMLLGLVRPSSGTGSVLGAPLGDRRVRARVGFLPEHFRFHEHLTARELLRMHGRLLGLRGPALESRIGALLERVNLAAAADRLLWHMSKGMMQRLGLAQALIGSPELVFLDEPTSGLDPLGRLLVRELMEEQRARGATVFLNSHLLGEVEAVCDRVAFVKQGRSVHELTLAEAGSSVELELTLGRVDAATLEGLAAFGSDLESHGNSVRLRAIHEDVMPDIARWLVAQGVDIHALASRRKSLEEWFVEVMGGQGAG